MQKIPKGLLSIIVIFTVVFCMSLTCLKQSIAGTDYIEKWEDLPKYKLLPPETYDIESAKRLIVLAIQATAFMKGDWWRAHGLLGMTRIPGTSEEALYTGSGYSQLFKTALVSNTQTKMEGAAEWGDTALVVLAPIISPNKHKCKSWIYQREHFIGLIGYELNGRFTYNKDGNYGRILSSVSDHRNSLELSNIIKDAYVLYKNIKSKGFDDKTLGDAIGIANDFLKYDGIVIDYGEYPDLPFAQQIYQDTVTAIVEDRKKGDQFYYSLSTQMSMRDLNKDDVIALPENEQQLNILVKLIKEDLDDLEKNIMPTSELQAEKGKHNPSVSEKIKETITLRKNK